MHDDREPLTAAMADEMLDGLPLVAAMGGSLDEMKRVRACVLAAGIPALVGCPGGPNVTRPVCRVGRVTLGPVCDRSVKRPVRDGGRVTFGRPARVRRRPRRPPLSSPAR